MRTAYYKQRAIAKASAQTMAHEINSFATPFADIVRKVEKILAQRESRVVTSNQRYELAKEIKTILFENDTSLGYNRKVHCIEQTLVEWYREGKLQLGQTTDRGETFKKVYASDLYDKEPMWKQEYNPCSEIKLEAKETCSLGREPNGINLFDSDATRINSHNRVQMCPSDKLSHEDIQILADLGWTHISNSWFYDYE